MVRLGRAGATATHPKSLGRSVGSCFFFSCADSDLLAEGDPFLIGHVIVRTGLERLAAKLLLRVAQLVPVAPRVGVLSGIDHTTPYHTPGGEVPP